MPPKRVEISMHGRSAAVFDGVTQIPGSLERCMAGIHMLLERRIPIVLKTVGLSANAHEILDIKRFADSFGTAVTWRFGQYLRDDLALSGAPYRLQLPEDTLQDLERQDPELWDAKREELSASHTLEKRQCGGGTLTFHIDARGQLQLCSNNRRAGYDLRTGNFSDGFYRALPQFPCVARTAESQLLSILPAAR
jgi:MoaA/NifB/PqqE/SkfB family radical SAM enzyme